MADADTLPYDYGSYGKQVAGYVTQAEIRANTAHFALDFAALKQAAANFAAAGKKVRAVQLTAAGTPALNHALRAAEEALLSSAGLPRRPWYKHTVYAPGEFTGYDAVVIPGVTEGMDANDTARTQAQIAALAAALNRAAAILEAAAK
jgi:N-acetylated-alpha-linked acidic dipeptidase